MLFPDLQSSFCLQARPPPSILSFSSSKVCWTIYYPGEQNSLDHHSSHAAVVLFEVHNEGHVQVYLLASLLLRHILSNDSVAHHGLLNFGRDKGCGPRGPPSLLQICSGRFHHSHIPPNSLVRPLFTKILRSTIIFYGPPFFGSYGILICNPTFASDTHPSPPSSTHLLDNVSLTLSLSVHFAFFVLSKLVTLAFLAPPTISSTSPTFPTAIHHATVCP